VVRRLRETRMPWIGTAAVPDLESGSSTTSNARIVTRDLAKSKDLYATALVFGPGSQRVCGSPVCIALPMFGQGQRKYRPAARLAKDGGHDGKGPARFHDVVSDQHRLRQARRGRADNESRRTPISVRRAPRQDTRFGGADSVRLETARGIGVRRGVSSLRVRRVPVRRGAGSHRRPVAGCASPTTQPPRPGSSA
jgi:hypothetical protein